MSWLWPRPHVEVFTRDTEFEIVADLSLADDKTLDVYYEPDEVQISVVLNDGRLCERAFAVPWWTDTKTTKAVLNNGILTITVTER